MAAGHDAVVAAIIRGQSAVIGKVAISLASSVEGLEIDASGGARITGDPVATIEGLVNQYSSLTGPLGVRLCYSAARPELARHPEVSVPIFEKFA